MNRRIIKGIAGLALMASGGCQSREFGEDLLPAPKPSATAKRWVPVEGALIVPEAAPFSLFQSQRYSAGQARADSSVDASGRASGSVTVEGLGNGWAEFEIGHAATPTPVKTSIEARFEVAYRYEFRRDDRSNVPRVGRVTLKALALDARRNVLRKHLLVELDPKTGPDARKGRETLIFKIDVDPNVTYQFILGGRVEAASENDPMTIHAELVVEEFRLTLASAREP